MKRAVDLGFVPSCIGKPYTFHGLLRGHDLDLLDQVAKSCRRYKRAKARERFSSVRSLPPVILIGRVSLQLQTPRSAVSEVHRGEDREMLMIRK